MLERDASWALCVAPMIDVTDRHCRYFHRLLAPKARLYTEMISTAAIEHGDQHRLLDFDPREQPVALQLGCSEPQRLAQAARIGERWGYAEINLNRSEEHTSELQSRGQLVCRLLLEKKKTKNQKQHTHRTHEKNSMKSTPILRRTHPSRDSDITTQ